MIQPRTSLSIALVSVVLTACAGSQSSEPMEKAVKPAPSSPPLAAPATKPPSFDAKGNPYLPGTTDLLARTFYFEYNRSELDPDALRSLKAHAQMLLENPDRDVTVEGHADERGSREYNLALGERRANAVRLFLVSAGVPSSQIEIISYGEERPEEVGHHEGAWSRNRRALMNYGRTNG